MLYIVGTPIGNLEDLSYRQAKIISSAEILLTEDTRSTGILLQRITSLFSLDRNPAQRLISYYKEKEFEKLPEVIELVQSGKYIALISQSGMPIISDPGMLLIQKLIKLNVKFEVIPGPTALITAIVHSGFDPQDFTFLGFISKKQSQVIQLFKRLNHGTYVFYESPHRINKTLQIMSDVIPEADVVVCRELTKKFEEIIRGKPKDLLEKNYKGEITVVMSNAL